MIMKKKILLIFLFCVEALFVMAQDKVTTHVVQRGESIESIAKYYNITIENLKKANPDTENFIYVGMKLVIPVATSQPLNIPQNNNSISSDMNPIEESDIKELSLGWQRNRPKVIGGVNYFASTFEDVKLSGHYGIFISASNIGYSLFGFDATLGSFNWGLVDKDFTSDVILLGPNVSYEIIPDLRLSCSAQCICSLYFVDTETKKDWAWALVPNLRYNINKLSIITGLFINRSFKKQGKVACGFEVGLGIGM